VLGDLSYHYDANGNRVGTGGAFARSLIPTAVPSTTYDQANQQLAFGDVTQTFDNNGNLLTQTDASGTTTYTWDARNRLAAISGPTVSASFAYDPFGRRTSKAINGQTMTFHYDAVDIVRESGEAGDASYLRTLTIDEALSRTDTSGLVTYLADILGSTVALADANGTPATDYTYEPFGRTSVSGVPSLNPFRFTGRENDGNGLYYYRARYYDPIRSQFLSEDPLGLAGGLNLFAYVAGNPVNFGDPSGLRIWVCNRRAEFPPMANHAYLWDDRPGITVRSCGRGSNSEREKGPAVDVCVPAPYSQSHEDEIMRCCRETANQGPWIPGRNDCHTSVERCLDKAGIPPTPAPGGRVGPICPPGPCPSEPED
jgi:RHS repeat-associated protein